MKNYGSIKENLYGEAAGNSLSVNKISYLDIKPEITFKTKEEEDLYQFIEKNLTSQKQGIYTNTLPKPKQGDLAGGHDILSESVGLMMQYALDGNSQTLFEKQYLYINEAFTVSDNLLLWNVGEDNSRSANCNAFIDDLRIADCLLDAYAKWGDIRYFSKAMGISRSLKKFNIKNQLPVDFYDYKASKQSENVTVTYLNMAAFKRLALYDKEWTGIFEKCSEIVTKAPIGEKGVFYSNIYNLKTEEYNKPKTVKTDEQLVFIEDLLKAGIWPQKTLDWLRTSFNWYGFIVTSYDTDTLEPANKDESTAIYAICSRIFMLAGDQSMAEKFYNRMNLYKIKDEASPLFGGYAFAPTGEGTSFNNLEALITIRERSNQVK